MASATEIQQLAAQKAGGSASLRPAWEDALQPLRQLDHPHLPEFVTSFASPHHARAVLQAVLATGNPSQSLADFFHGVEASEESLAAWANALSAFISHLHGRQSLPPWQDTLGYMDCCLQVCHGKDGNGNFPHTVAVMLDSHGFAGGSEA